MKKTLLLAGVACIFSYNANAMNISSDLKPYIGLDYVYSKADFKGEASRLEKSNLLKDNYNSGVINAGIKLGKVNQKNIFNTPAWKPSTSSRQPVRATVTMLTAWLTKPKPNSTLTV